MTKVFFSNMDIEFVIRCLMACMCGFLVGLERTRHQKQAGIRTYIIVAIGATLFTIVSKYVFLDVFGPDMIVDVSRVACNIVTGVGFLGAGTIFMRGDRIQGLATSAGIWVMAAIGMAIGCGMYGIASAATVLLFITQSMFFGRSFGSFVPKIPGHLNITMSDDVKSYDKLEKLLDSQGIEIHTSSIRKTKESQLSYSFGIRMPQNTNIPEVVEKITLIKGVRTIEF